MAHCVEKMRAAQKLYLVIRTLYEHGWCTSIQLARCLFLNQDTFLRPKGYQHEVFIRAKTSDVITAYVLLLRDDYATPAKGEMDLILDLGANTGCAAVYFSHHYPEADIYSVEPDRDNYQVLQRNVRSLPKVKTLNSGVWWREAQLEVDNPDVEAEEFQFHETTTGGIPGVTVGQLLDCYPEAKKVMLKMDVEGAEKMIFENASDWIHRVDYLQVEIHGCWKSVFDALVGVDYSAEMSGENMLIELHHQR